MDLPSAFEWSTQESEVEGKEPVDKNVSDVTIKRYSLDLLKMFPH